MKENDRPGSLLPLMMLMLEIITVRWICKWMSAVVEVEEVFAYGLDAMGVSVAVVAAAAVGGSPSSCCSFSGMS